MLSVSQCVENKLQAGGQGLPYKIWHLHHLSSLTLSCWFFHAWALQVSVWGQDSASPFSMCCLPVMIFLPFLLGDTFLPFSSRLRWYLYKGEIWGWQSCFSMEHFLGKSKMPLLICSITYIFYCCLHVCPTRTENHRYPLLCFYIVSNHIGNKMLVKLGYSKIYQFTFSFTEESNILPAPRRPLL
jgi:hypothetical protein